MPRMCRTLLIIREISCCQANFWDSVLHCTTKHTTGTAAVGLYAACAEEEHLESLGLLSECVACSETAVLLGLIINSSCAGAVAGEARVGGWATYRRLPGDYGVRYAFDLIISSSNESRSRTYGKRLAVLEQVHKFLFTYRMEILNLLMIRHNSKSLETSRFSENLHRSVVPIRTFFLRVLDHLPSSRTQFQ